MINSSVSLIIPAYNEEKTVGDVIKSAAEIMENLGLPYEIIVINDGSTDHTEYAILNSGLRVKVLENESNRGKGYSIRKAAKYANGDILVTLDSDGEHKPKEIPDLLAPLFKGIDIVSGSRFMGNSENVTTRLHEVGNQLFNFAIMAVTGKRVSDSQTGFRAMKKETFEKLNLQSDGYEIETEITVKGLLNGYNLKEVPISVKRRKYDASKIKLLPDGRKILVTIIRSSLSSFEFNPNESDNL